MSFLRTSELTRLLFSLLQIVFNIIGNAFKYCLKGSIRVFLRYREDEVEFGVQDVSFTRRIGPRRAR